MCLRDQQASYQPDGTSESSRESLHPSPTCVSTQDSANHRPKFSRGMKRRRRNSLRGRVDRQYGVGNYPACSGVRG